MCVCVCVKEGECVRVCVTWIQLIISYGVGGYIQNQRRVDLTFPFFHKLSFLLLCHGFKGEKTCV